MGRLLPLLGALAIFGGAPAHAQTAVDDPQLRAYASVAVAYWNADPCPAGISFQVGPAPNRGWAAWAWAGVCTVAFADTFYPYRRGADLSRTQWDAWTCQLVAHEYGHILGHSHQEGHGALMNHNFRPDFNLVAGCPRWQAVVSLAQKTTFTPHPRYKRQRPRVGCVERPCRKRCFERGCRARQRKAAKRQRAAARREFGRG